MPKTDRLLDAASRIGEYTDSMDLTTWLDDHQSRDAVQYCFIVIAEAAIRLRDHAPELAQQIPELDKIKRFRNILAHEYDRVDHGVIWEAVWYDLPPLQLTLQSLLAQVEGPDKSQTARPTSSSGSKPDDPDEESWNYIPDPYRLPSPFDPD